MKKFILLLIGVTLAFNLIGCKQVEDHEEYIGIRGLITELNITEDRVNILVEGEVEEDTQYDLAWVTITENTVVIDIDGSEGSTEQLQEGQLVEVWFDGGVNESYPVQGSVKRIKIVENNLFVLLDEVELEFTPLQPQWLLKGEADESLEYVRTLEYQNQALNPYKVQIYKNIEMENIMNGFLIYDKVSYDLGEITGYGEDGLNIYTDDMTNNGVEEIIIDGLMGATYVETKVIGINDEYQPVMILKGGSFEVVDLDNNGEREWIAASRGSLPPYVTIYRWNGDIFQFADVEKALGTNYALYYAENNIWFVESGFWQGDKELVSAIYTYDSGKLTRVIKVGE
ncbi:DUF3221 domain-containing protein [Alkaliphilus peptidifermentans]|uniref:DUF3221 domain-containing protein n=1 Tax=Alkaliphilus peptidifermentans DSM 18978 TaxID=1120976 RepID=A0A1G5GJ90_9FIRM|nr:DUF3221 domain-containing protein [Alkaliphilus peptidifermentans]SCY51409.1 Protein of unknown function [Alkaliphilus peptidifermentans DSM 18978]